jgi:hypothetical protein
MCEALYMCEALLCIYESSNNAIGPTERPRCCPEAADGAAVFWNRTTVYPIVTSDQSIEIFSRNCLRHCGP